MGIKNLFKSIFGRSRFTSVGGQSNDITFPGFSGNAYQNATVRSAVNLIAQQVAILNVQHYTGTGVERKRVENSVYERIFSIQANPCLNAYDFWCKMIAQREIYGDAYAYIDWDTEKYPNVPKGVYPIHYSTVTLTAFDNAVIAEFALDNGQIFKTLYDDLIHLTKYFNNNPFTSDGNSPLYQALDMIKTAQDGFRDSLNLANKIRGIHKQKIGMLDKADVRGETEDFIKRYNSAIKNGGIIGMDISEEYVPLNATPLTVTPAQMKEVREEVYRYINVSEKIMTSSYTAEEWSAFHNNAIMPILVQRSQELTRKCFTERERGFGNTLVSIPGYNEHMSLASKIDFIKLTKDLGALPIPEQRTMLGLSAEIPEGERQVSLNFVNADIQDAYQTGDPNQADPKNEEGGDESG